MCDFLRGKNIAVTIIGNGQGLPDGLLYDSKIYTLKPNSKVPSAELKLQSKQPSLRYVIRGRTDILVKYDDNEAAGHRNNKYLIELKTPHDFKEESALREAVLQLIGVNAGNYHHSPCVILSNLASKHYVLYIDLKGDPKIRLCFELVVRRMETFDQAINLCEELSSRESVTMHFCRSSSAPPSPPQAISEDDGLS